MAQIEIESVICSHCKKESKQYVLLSDNYSSERGLDTRPSEKARASFEYDVQMCPHCFYCNEDISMGGEIELGADYMSIVNDTRIDNLSKKLLLAYKVKFAEKRYGEALQLLLEATWILEDNKNPFYNKMMALLISQLEISVQKERDVDYEVVLIDLLRRAGSFDKALKYIDQIRSFDIEIVERFANYEAKLIKNGDTSHHLMEELDE